MSERLKEWVGMRLATLAGRLLVTGTANATGTDEAGLGTPIRVDGTTHVDEVRRGLSVFQPWGYTANPPEGAEAVYLQIGGSESHLVVLGFADPRAQVNDLEPGEVGLVTDEGVAIVVRRGRQIEVSGNGLDVQIAGNAAIDVGGDATIDVGGSLGVTAGAASLSMDGGTGEVVLAGTTLDLQGIVSINGDPYALHEHTGVLVGVMNTGPVA